MAEAVLGLGGNLGARRSIFRAASSLLDALPGCRVLARSRLYETAPLGPPQPDYLNAALRVRWEGDVDGLFAATQQIEQQLGRERRVRWGARTLDVDVLHWSEGAVQRAHLEVPHRELRNRTFALAPLLDVAPELEPVWGSVLRALHGAPPLAEPAWPTLHREGRFMCSEWLTDELELIAIALELTALSSSSGARARALLPFSGARRIESSCDLAWLRETIAVAATQGFAVHGVALTGGDAQGVSGSLIGEARPAAGRELAPELELERRGRDQKRVRMACAEPDGGFVSRGSVTM
jgi:2-amino-4-hydroxy-6-hydroxymethyldihydropteridine diphosphokinase